MSIGFIFWLLMLLSLVLGLYYHRGTLNTPALWGGNALLWILIFLLGWRVFGWPISG